MTNAAAPMVDVWRGPMIESRHRGHAAVVTAGGALHAAWGAPETLIYPRSSAKMLQALPLVESGAADAIGLGDRHLALAAASHQGAPIHTELASSWLAEIGRGEADLRCGIQPPRDARDREAMRAEGRRADQTHNNCSGKHTGFLSLETRIGGGPEYIDVDHPVQRAVCEAIADMAGEDVETWAIDGCSAPNFATSVTGLARAMARMAAPGSGLRGDAARQIVAAMARYPELVAGEKRACTELMRAMKGVAVKTGAEGVFVAILPEQGLGVALKIEDGATRAAEAAIAAILVWLGVLESAHPVVQRLTYGPIRNFRDVETGAMSLADGFPA